MQTTESERASESARARERESLAVFWGFGVDIELIRTRCIIHVDDFLLSRGAPSAIMINSAAARGVVRLGRRRHACLARAVSAQEKEEEEEGRRGGKRRGRRGFLAHQRQSLCKITISLTFDNLDKVHAALAAAPAPVPACLLRLFLDFLCQSVPVWQSRREGHVMERKAGRWEIREC